MTSPTHPHLVELPNLHCVKVSGAQSKTFLQGQLSCDIREVSPTHMQAGALCDLKGRVVALIDVVEWDELFLIYSSALHRLIQKNLTMPAKLSRVTLEDASSLKCVGLFCPTLSEAPLTLPTERLLLQTTQHVACYQIIPSYYLILYRDPPEWLNELPRLPESTWHQQLLQQQHVMIYPETSGQFLAQHLNLDKTGYISFNKGCYKGQEIIARMHFRGTNKYELVTANIATSQILSPGMPLLSPTTQQQVGEIVDIVSTASGRYVMLASVLKSEVSCLTELYT